MSRPCWHSYLNVRDLLICDNIVMPKAAIAVDRELPCERRKHTSNRRERGGVTMPTPHQIIVRPLITEKNTNLMILNKYSFEVLREAKQTAN
jgi:hypothetical protein